MSVEEIERLLKEVQRYRELATSYIADYQEELTRGDKEKAGEALWGAVGCLLNAIHIVKTGKPIARHDDLREFARTLLIRLDSGGELFKIFRSAEKLHANFYHAFLELDEFVRLAEDMLRLIEALDKDLVEEVKALALITRTSYFRT